MERYIIYIHGSNQILKLPLYDYETGDIKSTKKRLAEELHCSIDEIEVKITGIQEEKIKPELRVIQGGRSRF